MLTGAIELRRRQQYDFILKRSCPFSFSLGIAPTHRVCVTPGWHSTPIGNHWVGQHSRNVRVRYFASAPPLPVTRFPGFRYRFIYAVYGYAMWWLWAGAAVGGREGTPTVPYGRAYGGGVGRLLIGCANEPPRTMTLPLLATSACPWPWPPPPPRPPPPTAAIALLADRDHCTDVTPNRTRNARVPETHGGNAERKITAGTTSVHRRFTPRPGGPLGFRDLSPNPSLTRRRDENGF